MARIAERLDVVSHYAQHKLLRTETRVKRIVRDNRGKQALQRVGRLLPGLLLCGLLVALTFATPARAGALKAIWGSHEIASGVANCPSDGSRCSAFPIYEHLGVDVFQYQVHWNEVAPTRPANPRDPNDPAYDWGALDDVAAGARAHGIKLALLVQWAPPWANGGRPPIWAPRNPRLMADFLIAAARRVPSARHWMIWGEPSRKANFRPLHRRSRAGPRTYARMLDTAYVALKRVRPSNRVIGGMTFIGGEIMTPRYLRWMKLPNGRPPRMDLWGHNPYDRRFPDLSDNPIGPFRGLNDIDTLFREIRSVYRRGHRRVPRLWLSEWTVISEKPSTIIPDFYVPLRRQARWLRAGYRIARNAPYVAGLGWFSLFDQEPAPGSSNWGLMRSDGTIKPAYRVYRNVP